MSRSAQRQLALRICLAAVAWVAALFIWVSLLSFNPADAPSTTAWPTNAQAANYCGRIGALLSYAILYYFGVGAHALAALLTLAATAWSSARRLGDVWLRFIGLILIVTSVAAAGAMALPEAESFTIRGAGGLLGGVTLALLMTHLQSVGTMIVLACSFLVGLLLAADEFAIGLTRWMGWVGQRSVPVVTKGGAAIAGAGLVVAHGVAHASARLVNGSKANGNGSGNGYSTPATVEKPRKPAQKVLPESQLALPLESKPGVAARCATTDDFEGDDEPTLPDDFVENAQDPDSSAAISSIGLIARAERATPNREVAHDDEPPRGTSPREMPVKDVSTMRPSPPPRETPRGDPRPTPKGPYALPAMSLLDDPTPIDRQVIEMLCREKACILEQTLNEFRLEVQVVAIETGPVITVFELKLAPGIKVSQIASLANDMARALKAPAVRVVAPLPGKNTIGIEVPNIDKEKVRLKDLIATYGSRSDAHGLPIYLGKDASGQPLVLDLTKMPHGLIAGTTGSGKSVCVSSIVMSLLMARTPDEVNLILVDPKVVELAMFKDIPHLMCPIVTEISKAEAILDWAATKMDERYALLAEAGVKDIRAYNRLGHDALRERLQATDEEMQKVPVYLPYIVIMIDELADLMMTSAKEVEFYLCRLAQKSRAVGIHLIVSTQRPQANVVTGLIKSNLPCRIAFRVASRLDSRIVLDQNGAEVLMGQGDMLLLPPGSAKLVRAQGTFISDEELRSVVKHCREQRQPDFHPELVRMPSASANGDSERDELFDQAVDIVLETGRGSVSLLQRRLTVGYGRASRLIDQMYEAGIVGEYKGSQAREVVVSKDEWAAIRGQRDREEAQEAAG
ncbi:MAG: DNA translocase FtsK [Phycisphaerae bacterium]